MKLILLILIFSSSIEAGLLKHMYVEGKVIQIQKNHIVIKMNKDLKTRLPKKVLKRKSYKLKEHVKIRLTFNKVKEVFKLSGVSGGGDGTD
ncbi:MAG: hypothetical protein KC493_11870 [Bacteriovoracaceae bacterium]|nr:hypothetical protein [Bacteriovoracaceae bacterium]